MRTTINIDDQLLAILKKRASATDSTVSKLIEEAVKVMLNRKPPKTKERLEFELVTFGAGGQFSRNNIDKASALLEADDLEEHKRPSPRDGQRTPAEAS